MGSKYQPGDMINEMFQMQSIQLFIGLILSFHYGALRILSLFISLGSIL